MPIDVKGRNGWFNLRKVQVCRGPVGTLTQIKLFSQRTGIDAPVVIEGSREEILLLLTGLLDKLRAGDEEVVAVAPIKTRAKLVR